MTSETQPNLQSRANRRSIVLLVLMVTTLVGSVVGLWQFSKKSTQNNQQSIQAAENAQLERDARRLFQQAEQLQSKAKRTRNLDLLKSSTRLVDQIDEMLKSVPAESPIHQQNTNLREAIVDVKKTIQALAELEDANIITLSVRTNNLFPASLAEKAFTDILEKYGIDPNQENALDALANVRDEGLRRELAFGLDLWSTLPDVSEAKRARLQRFARQLDRDPWRLKLRQLLQDSTKNQEAIITLSRSVNLSQLSVTDLHLLSHALSRVNASGEQTALLNKVVLQFPDDFWLRLQLTCLSEQHLLATLTLRPQNPWLKVFIASHLLKYDRSLEARYLAQSAFEQADFPRPPQLEKLLQSKAGNPSEIVARSFPDEDLSKALEKLQSKNEVQSYTHQLTMGAIKLLLHDTKNAAKSLERAIQLAPLSAEAHGLAGVAHRQLDNDSLAKARLQEAVRLRKDYLWAWKELGNLLRTKGYWALASSALEQAQRLDKDDVTLQVERGILHLQQLQLQEAIPLLTNALKKDPKLLEARLRLAQAFLLQGKRGEGLKTIQSVTMLHPNEVNAHLALAQYSLWSGQPKEAIDAVKEALKLNAESPQGNLLLAQAYRDQQQLDEALKACETAMAQAKDDALLYHERGRIKQLQGQLVEAKKDYQRAWNLKPDEVQFQRSILGCSEQLVNRSPEDENLLYRFSLLARKLGFLESASYHLRALIQQAPVHILGLLELGSILLEVGTPDPAAFVLQSAVRLRNPQAFALLTRAYLELGKLGEAGNLLAQAKQIGLFEHPQINKELSQFQEVLKRLKKVEPALAQALRREPVKLSVSEKLDLARLASFRNYHYLAARLISEMVHEDESLLQGPALLRNESGRFQAMTSLLRAGTGQGGDALPITQKMKMQPFRRLALQWFQDEFNEVRSQWETGNSQVRADLQRQLRTWLADQRLIAIKNAAILQIVPEQEQQSWSRLWHEITLLAFQSVDPRRAPSPVSIVNQASGFIRFGYMSEALSILREGEKVWPDDASLQYQIADALIRQKKWEEGLTILRKVIELSPLHVETRATLGTALGELGQLAEAEKVLREAVTLDGGFYSARKHLAIALTMQNKMPEAVAQCKEMLKLRPNDADTWQRLASLQLFSKGPKEATEAFRQLLTIYPDSPAAQNQLLSTLRHALRENPQDPNRHLELAQAYQEQNYLHLAAHHYRELLKLEDSLPGIAGRLGAVLWKMGNTSEALTQMDAETKARPILENVTQLALAYLSEGDITKARETYERAMKLAGINEAVRAQLAPYIEQCRRFQLWETKLSQWKEDSELPDDQIQLFELIVVSYLKKHYAKASRWTAILFKKYPQTQNMTWHQDRWRYLAACASVLAGCGQDQSGATFTSAERATLREQGYRWMQEEQQVLHETIPQSVQARAMLQQHGRLWLCDRRLRCVRHSQELSKIPESEQRKWQAFWIRMIEASHPARNWPANAPSLERAAIAQAYSRFGFHRQGENAFKQVALSENYDTYAIYHAATGMLLSMHEPTVDVEPLSGEQQRRWYVQALEWMREEASSIEQRVSTGGTTTAFALFRLRKWKQDPNFFWIRDSDARKKLSTSIRKQCDEFWGKVDELIHRYQMK